MLRDYMSGKRKRYLSAGKYSFFLIVIFTVFASYLESHFGWFETMTKGIDTLAMIETKGSIQMTTEKDVKEIVQKDTEAVVSSGDAKEMNLKFDLFGAHVDKKVSKNELLQFAKYLLPRYHTTLFVYLKFFVILWIPAFAFFSFFFFWGSGYNFAEHITFNTYIYAHILLIYVLFAPLYWVYPSATMTTALTSTGAAFFFLIFSYFQFFDKGRFRLFKIFMSLSLSFGTYLFVLSTLITGIASYIFVMNLDKL